MSPSVTSTGGPTFVVKMHRTNRLVHETDVSNLEGKLLTIIDASMEDSERQRALKSLIRETLWSNWFPRLPVEEQQAAVHGGSDETARKAKRR